MKENARHGFWNGGPPPYGYRAVTVEVRADANKKRLEIDPAEAAIVREVFELHRQGNGIRSIAHHLSCKGLTYRKGRKFTGGLVHQILTREAYAGTFTSTAPRPRRRPASAPTSGSRSRRPVIIDPECSERCSARSKRGGRPANRPAS